MARTASNFGLALNEALQAFEREVHRMREKRRDRRHRRVPEPPYLGVVDRVFRDEGYGFILTEAGNDGPQTTTVTAAPLRAQGA